MDEVSFAPVVGKSIGRPEERLDRLDQRQVGILDAIFFDLVRVSGEFLTVDDQVTAFAVKVTVNQIAILSGCATLKVAN